jgi:putative (di)nucleoside polyphosphate hydrolase
MKTYVRSLVGNPRNFRVQSLEGQSTGKGYVVDADGFRPNVGIVLSNERGQVLWARRVGGRDAWQFPQGGIRASESVEDALYRELFEEVGLESGHVEILARTSGWLRYRLPKRMRRHNSSPGFVGQKQKWFLLRMLSADHAVDVTCSDKPEFDEWRWVSYWYPLGQVVDFKRDVYRRALKELAPHLQLGEWETDGGRTSVRNSPGPG